jgi:hypothetical protein
MENSLNSKCRFGKHISSIDKDRVVELYHRIDKSESIESLKNMGQKTLIDKYRAAAMDVETFSLALSET